ncbi:MAG: transcriptional regulator [Alphaproteobacteria bacterium]|nr:transcriptional regulator [Alphaproteobacteria bacterium]
MNTPYHYTECGLDNVLVYGIAPCIDDDGDEVITIPNINGLHKAIALTIIAREALMSGKELRFLRTEMGMTQAELARCVHKEAISVGRWERNETPIDPNAETLVRLMAQEKLELSLNVSVEELSGYSVQTANVPPIEIDGIDPDNYHQRVAA